MKPSKRLSMVSLIVVMLATPSFATPTELDKKTVASKAYVDTKQDIITTSRVLFFDGENGVADIYVPALVSYGTGASGTDGILGNKIGILDYQTVDDDEGSLELYSSSGSYGAEMDNFVPTVRAVAEALQNVKWWPLSWMLTVNGTADNGATQTAAINAYNTTFGSGTNNWAGTSTHLINGQFLANSLALKQNKIAAKAQNADLYSVLTDTDDDGVVGKMQIVTEDYLDDGGLLLEDVPNTIPTSGAVWYELDASWRSKIVAGTAGNVVTYSGTAGQFGTPLGILAYGQEEGEAAYYYSRTFSDGQNEWPVADETKLINGTAFANGLADKQNKLPAKSTQDAAPKGNQVFTLNTQGFPSNVYTTAGKNLALTAKSGAAAVMNYIDGTTASATFASGQGLSEAQVKATLVSLELMKDVYGALHTEIQNAAPTGTTGYVATYTGTTPGTTTGPVGGAVAIYDTANAYSAGTDANKIATAGFVATKQDAITTGRVLFHDAENDANDVYVPALVSYGTGTTGTDGILGNKIGILDQGTVAADEGVLDGYADYDTQMDNFVPTVRAVAQALVNKQNKLPSAWTDTTSTTVPGSTGGQTIDLGTFAGFVGRRYITAGGAQPLTLKATAGTDTNVISYVNGTKTLAQYQTSNFGATDSSTINRNENYIKSALVSLELLKDVYSDLNSKITVAGTALPWTSDEIASAAAYDATFTGDTGATADAWPAADKTLVVKGETFAKALATKQNKITTGLVVFEDGAVQGGTSGEDDLTVRALVATNAAGTTLTGNTIGILDANTLDWSDEGILSGYAGYGAEMDNFVPTVRVVADAIGNIWSNMPSSWTALDWSNTQSAAINAYNTNFTSNGANNTWTGNGNYLINGGFLANSLALKQNKITTGRVLFHDAENDANDVYVPALVSYGTDGGTDGILGNKIGILDYDTSGDLSNYACYDDYECEDHEVMDNYIPTVRAVAEALALRQYILPAAWSNQMSTTQVPATGGQTIELGSSEGAISRRYITAGGSQPLTRRSGADNVILYINGTKTLAQYQTSNFGGTTSYVATTNQNYIKGALVSLELLKDVYSALHTEIQNATPTGTPGNVAMYDASTGELGDGVATYDGSTTYNASTDADKIAVMSGVQRKKECGGYEAGHENDPDYCWLWIFPD